MTNNQHTDNNPTELDKGNTESWFFENTKGERVPYDHKGKKPLRALESQYGIKWNGDEWVLPTEFPYLRKD